MMGVKKTKWGKKVKGFEDMVMTRKEGNFE